MTPTTSEREHGDWFTNEDTGTHYFDFTEGLERVFSLLLKQDGSAQFVANVDGKKFMGNVSEPSFREALRAMTEPMPAGLTLGTNPPQQEAQGAVAKQPSWVCGFCKRTYYESALCCDEQRKFRGLPATPPAPVDVREKYDDVLLPFLALMRKELHANAGKGDRPGWLSMDRKTSLLELYYHLSKLQKAMKDDNAEGIREYAADVANMAMMAADICGQLDAALLDGQPAGVVIG